MTVLRKFARLSPLDRRLLARAARLVVLTRVALWALPLATVRRIVHLNFKWRLPVAPPERVAWAVRHVSGHVPQATCLVQAVATQTLLEQMGLESQLQVGVALDERGQLQAHAWVEQGGDIVIGGAESERYATLLSLDPRQHQS